MLKPLLALGAAGLVANEIRGAVMAGPVLVAMWHTGGTWLQAWILLCIAASVVMPWFIWRKVR